MWLLSLPYHMEGWRQGSSFLWKRDRWSCQVVEKYWQCFVGERLRHPFDRSPHPFWDEKCPSHHPALQCLLQQELLWENSHCCVWGQCRSCDLLCRSFQQHCAHALFLLHFCLHKIPWAANWPQLKLRMWVRHVSPDLFPETLWWYLVLFVSALFWSSASTVGQFGAQCPLFRQQESDRAHISPGWCGRVHREPAVSSCTAGSGKMISAFTNNIILAKFKPKEATILWLSLSLSCVSFSLTCIFLG